jgi:hypothetical protein
VLAVTDVQTSAEDWQVTTGPAVQTPAWHESVVVEEVPGSEPVTGALTPEQPLASEQTVPSGEAAATQVPFGSVQALTVQGLPVAVQTTAVPPQTPMAHLSPVVQARPSVQFVPSLDAWRWQRPSVVWPQTLSWQATVLAGQLTEV